MTFTEWLQTEAGQRAIEYAEQAPGAGLSMAWDAALESMNHTVQCPPCRNHLHCLQTGQCALAKAQAEGLRAFQREPF